MLQTQLILKARTNVTVNKKKLKLHQDARTCYIGEKIFFIFIW